jgi:shikimate dehydrogenase
MLPNVEATPWPEGLPFPPSAVAYDMIYAPRETTFLRTAKAAGARTLNGLNMLVHQGVQCFRLWTGQQPPLDVMFAAVTDQGVTH